LAPPFEKSLRTQGELQSPSQLEIIARECH
jgi:hypothetical protein